MPKHSKKNALGEMPASGLIAALLDSIADPAFIVDPDGSILAMNGAGALRITTYGRDVTRTSFYKLEAFAQQNTECTARLKEKAAEVLRIGKCLTLEEERGRETTRFTFTPVFSLDESVGNLVVVVHENLMQQLSEREVQKALAVYKSFRETMSHSFSIMDAGGRMMEWNEAARDTLFGMSDKEMLGFDGFKAIHPDDLPLARETFLKVLKLGNEEVMEVRVLVHGGPQYLWRMIYGKRVMIDDSPCVFAIGVDITDRKRVENKLNENRERLHHALEAAGAGIWEWDMQTGDNIWSDELWTLYGLQWGMHKPSFKLWESTVHPDDRVRAVTTVLRAAKREIAINIEYRVVHLDGTVRWLMARGKPLYNEKGEAVRYIGTSIDITERKQIELEQERLKESRAGFNAVLDLRHIGWWELDFEDYRVHRSLEHDRIFGYATLQPEWNYQKFLEHIIPEDRTEVDRQYHDAVAKLADWNIECRIRRKDGELRWIWAVGGYQFDKTGHARRMSGVIQDITKRKKAEEERESLQVQLQHSQKMQMVGQLAGGIAHDFNNMLMVILGHTELALQNKDSSFEDLEAIHKAATHSAELTSQLLAFARRQTVKTKVFDLNVEVERMLSILKRLIGENITLRWMPVTRESLVKLDPSQIDQILANLCVNARDAIEENGTITIETTATRVDEAACTARHVCSIPGEYVMLTVTDTGEGIDKKHLPHVIEPFFTTKEVGKGTGMGLATVYGIVKQNSGFIEVKSKKGKGTSVRIYLPLHQREDAAERSDKKKEPALPQGKEMILLVEDQPDILQLCRQMLERNGYTVLAARGPGEAIQLAGQYRDRIALLVTDVVMPEMNGSELYKKLQTVCPHLKALFMSGYTADFLSQHLKGEKGVNFIEKPFSIAAFTRIVQEILNKVPD
ncbi:MAG: PAS domain-containing protein [Chlorobiales bacterium]|nr:PAS domain-containing protein [Chlorobiales bacterium]